MKRLLLLSVVTLASLSLMGCQLFQQQPEASPEGTSESTTATINIREDGDQSATSTATLSIEEADPASATATGTLEITETEE